MKTTIIFGSSTDNTKQAAQLIAKKLSDFSPKVIDVAKATEADFNEAELLILGTSTWGMGDLQDDWEDFLPKFANINLSGKKVAIFGLGDGDSYPDTFVDGIGILYETCLDKGCEIIGKVPTTGYTYDESRAIVDGVFIGLPLNEDSESNQTESRVNNWIEIIKSSL